MTNRQMKIPGPEHPIAIDPSQKRVRVTFAGRVIADGREALTLREAVYPPVHYLPRKDVDMSLLTRTGHRTWCPYKGECVYFSISAGSSAAENAVWSYEDPFEAVAEIRELLAFYPDRVDAIEVLD